MRFDLNSIDSYELIAKHVQKTNFLEWIGTGHSVPLTLALKNAFSLPHSAAFKPYVKAFQFKILNSILYTNSKLQKIGYIADNLCSLCKRESKTINNGGIKKFQIYEVLNLKSNETEKYICTKK